MKPITFFSKLILFLFLISPSGAYPQSPLHLVRDHRNGQYHQVFNITELKAVDNNANFQKAAQNCDIIGNDFYGRERIGFLINKNEDGSYTASDFVPVDGYKHTFSGTTRNYVYSDGRIDKDLTIYLEVPSDDPRLTKYKYIFDRVGNFYEPWNLIEGEVNIAPSFRKFYKYPYQVPDHKFSSADKACVYGPWVLELKDDWENAGFGHFSDHKNNNEIHPVEQLWWKAKPSNRSTVFYHAALFLDNSGRFDSRSDYGATPRQLFDQHDQEIENFKTWIHSPLDGTFAILFQQDRKNKEKIIYTITEEANKYAEPMADDGKRHYLVYKGDTLVEVREDLNKEILNIQYVNVGVDPAQIMEADAPIKGFILIKCRIKGQDIGGGYASLPDFGNLKLQVCKQITTPIRSQVKITLISLKRLANNSNAGINPLTNRPITRFHPNKVPDAFEEKNVDISIRQRSQTTKFPRVYGLGVGDEYTFNNYSVYWEGSIMDDYSLYMDFSIPYGVNKIPLGNLRIGGDPRIPVNGVLKSIYRAEFNGIPAYDVNYFELTYKVEIIPKVVVKPN